MDGSVTSTRLRAHHRAAAPANADAAAVKAQAVPRPDLYGPVHKGLRTFMCETLVAVGRMDADDPAEVAGVLAQVRGLLVLCRVHLEVENRHVHPAMEARSPGSASETAGDHVEHERAFASLESDTQALERVAPERRAAAALHLYRQLAVFTGENFLHMRTEEIDNAALLWQTHTDDELVALQHAIMTDISPADTAVLLRWMVPSLAPIERARLLGGLRQSMPATVFEGMLASLKPHLAGRDWAKLSLALAA
ncbi:MAG: hypothetical protein IT515_07230 [Burkholderiales bacterium]|nr:hypothetical protein [Burkholderiales bacterium]